MVSRLSYLLKKIHAYEKNEHIKRIKHMRWMQVRSVNISLRSKIPLLTICVARPTSIYNGTCTPIKVNVEMRNWNLLKMCGIRLRGRRSIHDLLCCNCSSSSGRISHVDDDKQAVVLLVQSIFITARSIICGFCSCPKFAYFKHDCA